MADLYDKTDYFGTPESRDRDARLVGHDVKADTSQEPLERKIRKLHALGATLDPVAQYYISITEALLVERDALEAENKRLREAGQAIVDRWDTPLWKYAEATGHVINRLRAALKGDKT